MGEFYEVWILSQDFYYIFKVLRERAIITKERYIKFSIIHKPLKRLTTLPL